MRPGPEHEREQLGPEREHARDELVVTAAPGGVVVVLVACEPSAIEVVS